MQLPVLAMTPPVHSPVVNPRVRGGRLRKLVQAIGGQVKLNDDLAYICGSSQVVTDHDGVQRTIPPAVPPVDGARVVRNLLLRAKDFVASDISAGGTALVTQNGCSVSILAGGELDVVFNGSDAKTRMMARSPSVTDGFNGDFIASCELKARVPSDVGKTVVLFSRADGPYAGASSAVTLTDQWQRLAAPVLSGVVAGDYVSLSLNDAGVGGASGCLLRNPQVEDVTVAVNQAPGEFVPVGLLYKAAPVPAPTALNGWADNGDGTYSLDGTQVAEQQLYFPSIFQSYGAGADWVSEIEITNWSAGFIYLNSSGATTGQYSGNGTYLIPQTPPVANNNIFGSVDFVGTVRYKSVRRKHPGVEYRTTENANSVDANGIVTEAAGAAIATVPSLVVEPTRTNLLPWSTPDATNWAQSAGAATTSGAALDARGVMRAALVNFGGGHADGAVSITASDTATVRVEAKAGSLSVFRIRFGGGGNYVDWTFDLGSVTASSLLTGGTGTDKGASITAIRDGWYLLEITASGVGDGAVASVQLGYAVGTAYFGRCQVELSAAGSAMIETAGAALTRAAQRWVVPNDWVRDIAGTLVGLFEPYGSPAALGSITQFPLVATGGSLSGGPAQFRGNGASFQQWAGPNPYDGTTWATAPFPPENTPILFATRWGGAVMQAVYAGTAQAEAAYDGGFLRSSVIDLFLQPQVPLRVARLDFYSRDKGQAFCEQETA